MLRGVEIFYLWINDHAVREVNNDIAKIGNYEFPGSFAPGFCQDRAIVLDREAIVSLTEQPHPQGHAECRGDQRVEKYLAKPKRSILQEDRSLQQIHGSDG